MTPEQKIQMLLEGKTPKEVDQLAAQVENPAVVPMIDPVTGEIANPDQVNNAPEEEKPPVSLENPLSVDPLEPQAQTKTVQEELSESLKLIGNHGDGQHTAKVYKDTDVNEYHVRFYKDGQHLGDDSNYYTDDKDDANNTAKAEIEGLNKHVNESLTESYAVRHNKVSAEAVVRFAKELFPDAKPLEPTHLEAAKDLILENIEHHRQMFLKHEQVNEASVEELLAADANLTEEYKAKAKQLFEEEVEFRVSTRIQQIQEEYDQKIMKLSEELTAKAEKSISEMSEKIDVYLEESSEKWIVENREALEAKAKVEIMESFMAGVKSLYEKHNMNVPESDVNLIADMQQKLDEANAKMDEQSNMLSEAIEQVNKLTRTKILNEAADGLTKLDKIRFEQLAESVEFESESEYRKDLNSIKQKLFIKRDVSNQALNENMSTKPILEENNSKALDSRMQSYLRALGSSGK